MTQEVIIYIIIAGVVAITLAVFMYGYKSKLSKTLRWALGSLRFITLFAILLLLINPKFKNNTYTVEKPQLPVLVDNSASVVALNQKESVLQLVEGLKTNKELNDKFDLAFYSFGSDFRENDSLTFKDKSTNIAAALSATNELYKNKTAPVVLITDGNQTLGNDYEFISSTLKTEVYPIILGDSTKYVDLKINQLNANKYAFLKNDFPVEVILNYSGNSTVNSQLQITRGEAVVYRKQLTFSESETSQTLQFTLPASSVGLQKYKAQILPLSEEKNTTNNTKHFAIEVIDQATNVLIVSDVTHPDLGALKKAIESNERRTATIKKPLEAVNIVDDYQLVILYQPNRSFASLFGTLNKIDKNIFVVTGLATEWNFLNGAQEIFSKIPSNQSEEVQANLNTAYSAFAVKDIGFNNLPPLYSEFGELTITAAHDILLNQTVSNLPNGNPLIASIEQNGRRLALWDGEGFWRWRSSSYLNTQSFKDFDDFIGGIVQYLASNKRRSRLEVSSEAFFYSNNPIKISAQYFDKNYVFDSRASLNISVKNKEEENTVVFPMLLRNNYYEVDLNSLPAGEYNYTISVKNEAVSRSGSFTILDFNVEQQFLNADILRLQHIADNTNGNAYFLSQYNNLIASLLSNTKYQNIEKSEQKIVPLLDWKYLLFLIVLSLAAEWFIRKYNGLI